MPCGHFFVCSSRHPYPLAMATLQPACGRLASLVGRARRVRRILGQRVSGILPHHPTACTPQAVVALRAALPSRAQPVHTASRQPHRPASALDPTTWSFLLLLSRAIQRHSKRDFNHYDLLLKSYSRISFSSKACCHSISIFISSL